MPVPKLKAGADRKAVRLWLDNIGEPLQAALKTSGNPASAKSHDTTATTVLREAISRASAVVQVSSGLHASPQENLDTISLGAKH
mmetsp:Transcript_67420/g.166551  ORF Transcript_67420/g.166551 Transcript_67420/m.166551 type:complete len:85 (-) Transcript_67420:1035-1289(-)